MDDLVKSNKHTIFHLIKEVFHKHSKAIQDGVVINICSPIVERL